MSEAQRACKHCKVVAIEMPNVQLEKEVTAGMNG